MDSGTELTLGVGLGFLSVALGVLGLIMKSECEEVSCCWGACYCRKPQKHKKESGESRETSCVTLPPSPPPLPRP